MSDIADKVIDGTHTRANVRALIASIEEYGVRGVPVPSELAQAVAVIAARLMKSDSPRIQNSGAKLVMAALRHNLDLAVFADKAARLDSGQPTERIETPIKFIRGTDGSGV